MAEGGYSEANQRRAWYRALARYQTSEPWKAVMQFLNTLAAYSVV